MNDEEDRITILVVEENALIREGLREILDIQPDMRVVGEGEDSATTAVLAAEKRPDVVLLGIEIPDGEVIATVSQIRDCSPRSRMIVLSMHDAPRLIDALLTAGIRGYLLKSIHWQELVAAMRAVCADNDRIILGVSGPSSRPTVVMNQLNGSRCPFS
jgi:DNA-binding NarL/FixJ family response regulator